MRCASCGEMLDADGRCPRCAGVMSAAGDGTDAIREESTSPVRVLRSDERAMYHGVTIEADGDVEGDTARAESFHYTRDDARTWQSRTWQSGGQRVRWISFGGGSSLTSRILLWLVVLAILAFVFFVALPVVALVVLIGVVGWAILQFFQL